ncbi:MULTISPECIES: efflux RND transporter periplasmic adaptor subunit [unclassified Arcicella]|uniref:efflux RND transporter periplasmic adaptor subunit n=1 Tax=unclassified Arcicella TaxID=2644986 RepID=UPI002859D401|nr:MULTISPECIES: efflux RND transporter periplasmic adaptor subunit [unclassified Arcicella]MDR6560677.1 membrane fusion protein (multidrug efflux system) [Arcicella sp. BE51]MDR6810561.1 membrane fusion protein (multidrug efflux system) [Arcicella sp. BE140]MDR6821911.1 membrane fusion protein (multidrug efflux system) [Arcicella sp. BE139]
MKKVFVLLCFSATVLCMTACSTNKESKEKQEAFPTTNPIIIDTDYNNDYVSDIHAIKNVEIRARVKGYIDKILVDEGKSVKQGQILFCISNQEYKEEILKAKAMLKSAIAEAKAAELNLQNVKLLVDKNVVSKTEFEMAKAKLDALNARIEEAQSHETSAKLKLSLTEIKAPFDGVVDRIPNKIGSLIDEGTLLTTISDNKEVFAYFNVSEREYLDFAKTIKESAKSEVSLILANNEPHNYKGNIETIEGEFDKNTGSIAFRARFANPERILRHGSSGKVRINNNVKSALVIPQKSTFEIQDKIFVYVLDKDNKVQTRSIVPRLRIPHLYVIETGLTTSDRIIYEGIQNVKDGMKIIPEMISMTKIIADLRSK